MLVLYAIAMGWLEGVVVVYIRGLVGLGRAEGMPPAGEVMRRINAIPWLLSTEQGRELATMIMLWTVAYLASPRWPGRIGAWLVSFGVWDIAYYVALHALLGWPTTLGTMDLLFLIPAHPWWYQPVWLPVGISCVMIGVGARMYFVGAPRPR